ncbi:MAG TPA: hypothetical protein VLQ93_21895, partial [Myxococcaceae bacterium]|nr:hypothetical protein [Myxococcaceae bacterium]
MKKSANLAPEFVLVVDDEPSVCTVLSLVVQREGVVPVVAANAAAARQLAERHDFACALID